MSLSTRRNGITFTHHLKSFHIKLIFAGKSENLERNVSLECSLTSRYGSRDGTEKQYDITLNHSRLGNIIEARPPINGNHSKRK